MFVINNFYYAKIKLMSIAFPIEKLKNSKEIIICDSDISRNAHKILFRLNDELYITTNGTDGIFSAVSKTVSYCNTSPSVCPAKIQIVVNWINLLKVSLWKDDISTGEVFMLLKNAGINSNELQPFKNSDINDIFPYLFYGKRLDILRRICHSAKKKVESNLKNNSIRIDCHIISEDIKGIIASSL
ncbi:MAG: hypothetical protein C0415_04045 [Thermodesulfovibrio sp.]|nr:hypothetical protein [Thermodesulfovibrio sp.]